MNTTLNALFVVPLLFATASYCEEQGKAPDIQKVIFDVTGMD